LHASVNFKIMRFVNREIIFLQNDFGSISLISRSPPMEFQIGDKGENPTIFYKQRTESRDNTSRHRHVDRQKHDLVQEMQQKSLQP